VTKAPQKEDKYPDLSHQRENMMDGVKMLYRQQRRNSRQSIRMNQTLSHDLDQRCIDAARVLSVGSLK
jgi:hypothetical protein